VRSIAITSGKGGVGKTFIAINLGCALAEAGKRVVLFDADLQLANLDVALGIESEYSLQHVVSGEKTLTEVLTSGPMGMRIVTGGSGITSLMHAGPQRLAKFMSQLDDLAETTDFLLFDTAAGLDNRVFAFLKRADEVLVVLTPEPTSVTDAYATIKVLFRRKHDAVVRALVNRASSEKVAKATYRALKSTVQNFLDQDLLYAGCVSRDEAIERATLMRAVAYTQYPEAEFVQQLQRAARELIVPANPQVLYESA